jgi:hypothetical protein
MSNTAFSEGKPVSANNLFADLEALRLSPEAAAVAGASEILSHVPIRKPNRHEFFRTQPNAETPSSNCIAAAAGKTRHRRGKKNPDRNRNPDRASSRLPNVTLRFQPERGAEVNRSRN